MGRGTLKKGVTISLTAGALLSTASPALGVKVIPGRALEDHAGRPLATVSIMLLDRTETVVDRTESDSLGFFSLEPEGAGGGGEGRPEPVHGPDRC